MIHGNEAGQQAKKMAKICRTCVKIFALTRMHQPTDRLRSVQIIQFLVHRNIVFFYYSIIKQYAPKAKCEWK